MIKPDSHVFIDGETMTLDEAHTRYGTGSFPLPAIEGTGCFSVAEYMRIPFVAPLGFLGGGILPMQSKMILFGEPKTGKSFVVMQIAEAIAEKHAWADFKPHPAEDFIPTVLYLQTEISESEFRGRLSGLPSAPENFYVETIHGYQLLGPHFETLVQRVEALRPDVLILDPLYMLMEGDLNSSVHMGLVHRNIDMLIAAYSCSVIIVHHSRKPKDGTKASILEALGSITITAFYDSILFLEKAEDFNLMHFTLRHSVAPEPLPLYQQKNGMFIPLNPLSLLTNEWQTVADLKEQMGLEKDNNVAKALTGALNLLSSNGAIEKTTNHKYRRIQCST